MIDAHHHFWQPARGDYGWIPPGDPVLDRAWLPRDLAPGLAAAGITRTVLVQAAPSVAETDWMLGIADATPHVAAVVGWIDFEDPTHLAHLERWALHPKFRGVRPMIQDIEDPDWMLRDDVQWAFAALMDMHLTFDALGFSRHLANFATILRRYPGLRFVIDHAMKPDIADPQAFGGWAGGMARLADAGAFCKLSGLLTEAAPGAGADALRPYAAEVLRAFGPQRVMWGSDWPVLRLRCGYEDWRALALDLTADLDAGSVGEVFARTAARFYGIDAE